MHEKTVCKETGSACFNLSFIFGYCRCCRFSRNVIISSMNRIPWKFSAFHHNFRSVCVRSIYLRKCGFPVFKWPTYMDYNGYMSVYTTPWHVVWDHANFLPSCLYIQQCLQTSSYPHTVMYIYTHRPVRRSLNAFVVSYESRYVTQFIIVPNECCI